MLTRSSHKYNTRLATRKIQRVNYANMVETNNWAEDYDKSDPEYKPYVHKKKSTEVNQIPFVRTKLPVFTVSGFNSSNEVMDKTIMEFNWIGDAIMYGEILTQLGKMDKSYYKYRVKNNEHARKHLLRLFSEIHHDALEGILFHYHRTRVAYYSICEDDGAVYDCPFIRKRLIEKHRIIVPL